MNHRVLLLTVMLGTGMSLSGCGHAVPPELATARRVYARASKGTAARLAPAELHKAEVALQEAERAFDSDPDGVATRDLAYIAERKAETAEALAAAQRSQQRTVQASKEIQKTQGELVQRAQGELAKTREQLDAERQARTEAEGRAQDAERRAREAMANLAKLAAVKEEARGMVITLSGSVLFASDESTLLPAAQRRLDQVAEALLSTKERSIVVEGYTDSRGSEGHNVDLSQRRADAVRGYIVSRGYPQDKIQSRGMGKVNPVADNGTAEGRANNRRVEIVVQPQGST